MIYNALATTWDFIVDFIEHWNIHIDLHNIPFFYKSFSFEPLNTWEWVSRFDDALQDDAFVNWHGNIYWSQTVSRKTNYWGSCKQKSLKLNNIRK